MSSNWLSYAWFWHTTLLSVLCLVYTVFLDLPCLTPSSDLLLPPFLFWSVILPVSVFLLPAFDHHPLAFILPPHPLLLSPSFSPLLSWCLLCASSRQDTPCPQAGWAAVCQKGSSARCPGRQLESRAPITTQQPRLDRLSSTLGSQQPKSNKSPWHFWELTYFFRFIISLKCILQRQKAHFVVSTHPSC